MKMHLRLAASLALASLAASAAAADPYADSVVAYAAGDELGGGPLSANTDPAAALGEPTRFTAPASAFGGPTTPFNSPFGPGEFVSVGVGGSLTLAFDEPVTDDPRNPFGIDLLVFGNSFLVIDFGAGTATGDLFSGGGVIEVSANGVDFETVLGAEADGLFPTVGYRDVTEPFPSSALLPSDFTLPVDPSLTAADFAGLNTAEIVALYNRSGGGAGIDIGALGFSEVSFVRITNPAGASSIAQIDAVADVRPVPEPTSITAAGLGLIAVMATGWARRPRRLV